jgi:hypothetical protein
VLSFRNIFNQTACRVQSGEPLTKTPLVILGLALIAFAVTFGVLYAYDFQPFNMTGNHPKSQQTPSSGTTSPTANPTLSPARNLIGTWETAFPTKFYIKTDFSSDQMQTVGSEDRTMTWVITAGSSESTVNVEVTFTSSNTQLIDESGYTPDVSPMELTGTISGTRLTLQGSDGVMGTFDFTSDNIHGTWNDNWTAAYSQQVYTVVDGLTLSRIS